MDRFDAFKKDVEVQMKLNLEYFQMYTKQNDTNAAENARILYVATVRTLGFIEQFEKHGAMFSEQ